MAAGLLASTVFQCYFANKIVWSNMNKRMAMPVFESFRREGAAILLKARGVGRDLENDLARLVPIGQSIDAALASTEAEYAGLKRRIGEVVARAAVTLGNGTDEYLYRDPRDNECQRLFDQEMIAGSKRLEQLLEMIGHLKFLRTAFNSRFQNEGLGGRN
jgi:hypothetical protein